MRESSLQRKNDGGYESRQRDAYYYKSRKPGRQRRRGKKLNLVGEEDTGAQLFHSSRVYTALEYQSAKEAVGQAEKAEKEAKKAQAAENKQKKKDEAQEKALQRQVDREIKAQKKADKLAAKQAAKS